MCHIRSKTVVTVLHVPHLLAELLHLARTWPSCWGRMFWSRKSIARALNTSPMPEARMVVMPINVSEKCETWGEREREIFQQLRRDGARERGKQVTSPLTYATARVSRCGICMQREREREGERERGIDTQREGQRGEAKEHDLENGP